MSEFRPSYATTHCISPCSPGTICALCGQVADAEHPVVEVEERTLTGLRIPALLLCLDGLACLARAQWSPQRQQARLAWERLTGGIL